MGNNMPKTREEMLKRRELKQNAHKERIAKQQETILNTIVDDQEYETTINVVEESKLYVWVRVYLNEELEISKGDKVTLEYTETNETLEIEFGSYNKSNIHKDMEEQIADYDNTDDKKVLCLMVDIKGVEKDESIPFIRTLFRESKWYTHQLLKRTDLLVKYKNTTLDYYTIDF